MPVKTRDSKGRVRRASQGGAGPKKLPDKTKAAKTGVGFSKVAPSHLGAHGQEWWAMAVKQMDALGILDAADRAIVELAAETFGDYRDAQEDIAQYGRLLMDDHGNQKRNPAFITLEKARVALKSFYSDLGLTPSARAKFGGGEDEDDPMADLLKSARRN